MKIVDKYYFRDKHIELLFKWFDWQKVQIVMNALDWCWAPIGDVPTIEEMKATAKYLLEYVYKSANENKRESTISTGGFSATCYWSNEKQEVDWLDLQFIVSDFNVEFNKETIEQELLENPEEYG